MANQVRLNHELLLWRGFTLSNGVWSYPDGVTVDNGVPYFPESLDEIFKWLWDKAIQGVEDIDLSTEREASYKLLGLWLFEDNPPSALALCLAIQKLIRSKQ